MVSEFRGLHFVNRLCAGWCPSRNHPRMGSMLMPTAQTLDQIVGLRRSWWRQYLIEFAKLVLKGRAA
jgi:hypothetical protein